MLYTGRANRSTTIAIYLVLPAAIVVFVIAKLVMDHGKHKENKRRGSKDGGDDSR